MQITRSTQLNILNSRFGSRLTFNLNIDQNMIETGNLGVDIIPKKKQKYIKQQLAQFRFYVKCGTSDYEGFYCSKLNSYLGSQDVRIGLTDLTLQGTHSSQLEVELKIINPMTRVSNLDQEIDMKILHSPFFLIEIKIVNNASFEQKIESFLGFNLEEKPRTNPLDILFLDTGKNNIEDKEKLLALRNLQPKFTTKHVDVGKEFKGFLFNKVLPAQGEVNLKYIYAGFTDETVIKDKMNESRPVFLKFYYTKWFSSITAILDHVEQNYETISKKSKKFEERLNKFKISIEKKELMAISFRSYVANTWLLASEKGPRFYVWDGSRGIISAVPNAMETEIIALLYPWTLRLQLMEWKRFLTVDEKNGLVYLKRDMGFDQEVGFSGHEDGKKYESEAMPVECNANFSILLYWYYHVTQDKETLDELAPTALRFLMGNKKRAFRKSGIANVGDATAYLDAGLLSQCNLNSYLAVKECVSYIMHRECCKILGLDENVDIVQEEAEKISDALEYYHEKQGFIPVSLDPKVKGGKNLTIATCDPLFYVFLTNLKDPIIDKIISYLKKDFTSAIRGCEHEYGIRFLEMEEITWFSKITVIEAVAKNLFDIQFDGGKHAYQRNCNNPLAYVDGVYSVRKEFPNWRSSRGVINSWEIFKK